MHNTLHNPETDLAVELQHTPFAQPSAQPAQPQTPQSPRTSTQEKRAYGRPNGDQTIIYTLNSFKLGLL